MPDIPTGADRASRLASPITVLVRIGAEADVGLVADVGAAVGAGEVTAVAERRYPQPARWLHPEATARGRHHPQLWDEVKNSAEALWG